ncbi:MAG: hypothetical protein ACYSTZ_08645, partial [Planctomycetota bacterium]
MIIGKGFPFSIFVMKLQGSKLFACTPADTKLHAMRNNDINHFIYMLIVTSSCRSVNQAVYATVLDPATAAEAIFISAACPGIVHS